MSIVPVGHKSEPYKIAEPIKMLLGGGDSRKPKEPCIKSACTLSPLGQYDRSICAAAAIRAVATITVATCVTLPTGLESVSASHKLTRATKSLYVGFAPNLKQRTVSKQKNK